MKTYQDWLEVANKSENERMSFIQTAINEHKGSKAYRDAVDGENYYNGENTTIKRYEKILFNAAGQAVPDMVSANHKIATRFFYRSVNQATATLLGNGISWKSGDGAILDVDMDGIAVDALRTAQTQGASYGFYNNHSIVLFSVLDFVPFLDEEDGAIKAGVRFWQIDNSKPLRATMYELDGFTEYEYKNGESYVRQEKRGYIEKVTSTPADGDVIYEYENYPTFPIVPLYLNKNRQSELIPIRPQIDARDLIASHYANDISDTELIFWTITNSGGMDDGDLVKMLDKLRKIHATQIDNDVDLQAHSVEPSYEGREAILNRLDADLYKDAMALDTYNLSSGAVTATQIRAAYEPLNEKLDIYERAVTKWIKGLLSVAGSDGDVSYDRSILINKSEEITSIVQSALYLEPEYITEKIMTILGDKDRIEQIKKLQAEQTLNRFTQGES